MADNNNNIVASLPKEPHVKLKQLGRLLGAWKVHGPEIDGSVRFEWMEGGFFLIQHIDFVQGGQKIKGIEYISYDQDTDTLRSHFMDSSGSNFTYTWQLDGDTLTIWFGDKDSPLHYVGTFNEEGNVNSGRWSYPDGGGYESTMTQV